jgi:histidyl-tRNA synthetase
VKEKIGGGGRYDALISSMGGGNAPACGFALYLDRLMKQVEPVDTGEDKTKKVLVKAPADSVKEAFKAAEALRGAGYIAEIDIAGQKAGWVVEVKNKASSFTLVNKARSAKNEFKTIAELTKYLEGQGGN